jgi:hypothetical protein
LRVRHDEDNGDVAARPSLPPQRQVKKQIMKKWLLHEQMLRNPPTDRMRDVHMLHHTQSVPMLDENSALRDNMPQHNDEQPRLSFSPAASVWGQMGRAWTTDGRNAPCRQSRRGTMLPSSISFSGSPTTLPSLLSRMCHAAARYFVGGEGAWDHVNSCIHHAPDWTCAHDHVLRALARIWNDAGFATNHKRVLSSEGNRRADLEIRNIRVAQQTDLLVDVTLRHNFIGAGQIGLNQGQLRKPDNPDHILESAAADKIRNYRDTHRRNRHVAFLPACMSTSGRIHGELLRLI